MKKGQGSYCASTRLAPIDLLKGTITITQKERQMME